MSSPGRESAAIILDCRDHGESDKIVTFFTKDRGRLTGIAKGANRSKKRFLNKLELFSSLAINYKQRSNASLVFIEEAELHAGFINLRSRTILYECASVLREIILITTAEKEEDKDIYHLLHWALEALDQSKPHYAVVAVFLLRLYDLIGYCPELSCCRSCNMAASSHHEFVFHYMTGGLVCSNCRSGAGGNTAELSPGTIKILQSVMTSQLDKLHRLQFSRQALLQSLSMLYKYGRHLLQRDINSLRMLLKNM